MTIVPIVMARNTVAEPRTRRRRTARPGDVAASRTEPGSDAVIGRRAAPVAAPPRARWSHRSATYHEVTCDRGLESPSGGPLAGVYGLGVQERVPLSTVWPPSFTNCQSTEVAFSVRKIAPQSWLS